MQITIISDCRDDNARARQEIRYQALFGDAHITFIGASSDLEAAGCLVDAIDAHYGKEGIIIVNVAPRGNKIDYPNGAPFSYHQFGSLWIIGTPNCFSLGVMLGMFDKTKETDVLTACSKFLPKEEAERIASSQFRSYEYLPHLAKWLSDGEDVPSNEIDIIKGDVENKIWYIDCFGNAKTTMIKYNQPNLSSKFAESKMYEKLADVPKDGNPAFTRGSSGYDNNRFLELTIQKGSAARTLDLKIGDSI